MVEESSKRISRRVVWSGVHGTVRSIFVLLCVLLLLLLLLLLCTHGGEGQGTAGSGYRYLGDDGRGNKSMPAHSVGPLFSLLLWRSSISSIVSDRAAVAAVPKRHRDVIIFDPAFIVLYM